MGQFGRQGRKTETATGGRHLNGGPHGCKPDRMAIHLPKASDCRNGAEGTLGCKNHGAGRQSRRNLQRLVQAAATARNIGRACGLPGYPN